MSDFEDIDPAVLDDEQLARHLDFVHTRHAALEAQLKKVKEEVGRRAKRPGTRVVGNIALNLSRAERFSPDLAKQKLTARQLRQISVSKPDSKLAQELLGKDSPQYKALCEPSENWTIRVTEANTKHKVMDADGLLDDPFSEEETD